MRRIVDKTLSEWKESGNRKVLLLRGARQVGKTYSVRQFAKSFNSFVEVNFEEHQRIHSFFEQSLTPQKIIEKLSLFFQQSIIPGETLLFFDEIQAAPNAIRSLRFFHEKMPELHLVAAGSLLEFALSEIPSYGVGRIESRFMYPLSFLEFLDANGADGLVALIKDSKLSIPIDSLLHDKIIDYLKIYHLIGGLPDVVDRFVATGDLIECQNVLDALLLTYTDDFAKYREKIAPEKLLEVFKSIAEQSGGKFKYTSISTERSVEYKQALDLFVMAGIAYKVYHTSAQGVPLGAHIKTNRFKVVLFDTGVYQRLLKLNLSAYAVSNYEDLLNRGSLAELFACNELIASGNTRNRPEIFYWHREKRGSNAEIDYVIERNGEILPIEVKAGTKGQMQSLYLFLEERKILRGYRVSGENFGKYGNIIVIPAYAVGNLWEG
ncbi:AAA family ATPase [bacterium]|nr:AAA family ATPase [bacterium]